MKFDQTDILFASLVGSKVAESIPRFGAVQNELAKHVLPPIPFLPFKNTDKIDEVEENDSYEGGELWKADLTTPKDKQFFPLSFSADDEKWYLLPYEPMLNITGKNSIVRRKVAKVKNDKGVSLSGTIKERWTRDDYEITITGALIGSLLTGDIEECFPKNDFQKLKDYMIEAKRISIRCEPLQLLDISHIVVEDFSFPFTKGENVQAYEIKAYSDFDYKLLLDIND